jgi:hypothetical protein
VLGFAICGVGLAAAVSGAGNAYGIAMFALMLMLFSSGAVLVFINFLALRQAVTPTPLLGRMTSTMRWLILIPPVRALCSAAGWASTTACGFRSRSPAAAALLLAALASRWATIRECANCPRPTTRTPNGSAAKQRCGRAP